MTSSLPEPFKAVMTPNLHEESWRILDQLVARYGADTVVRAIRLRQMTEILNGTPNDAPDPEPAPD